MNKRITGQMKSVLWEKRLQIWFWHNSRASSDLWPVAQVHGCWWMTPECWRYSDGCISGKPQHFAWPEYMPEKTQIQTRPSHNKSQKFRPNLFLRILESFWSKGSWILALYTNLIYCACSSVRCRRDFCDCYYEVDRHIWACVNLIKRFLFVL